ncbi:uncharacterized protein LOC131885470 [Tigriopus californicus]|uniref:uncharacterized protein LOC131885470 n=1 Tax=Tigriopus californicus TaxID=6832 RepID=UPI0027DA1F87|nr:uncharacterized protein LOC131885470 [Tigriopus californicus]
MGIYYNLLLVVVLLACGALSDEDQKSHRQKRLFSIFNIVTFKNDVCTTTGTGNLQGTCLTSTECTAKGGSSSGNCAAGFGVCCLFSVSGACTSAQTISQVGAQ